MIRKTRPCRVPLIFVSFGKFSGRASGIAEKADRKEGQMNTPQASRAWEVSEKEVHLICKEMGIEPNDIPDDTVPVYVPDRAYEDKQHSYPHRYYIYLMDVIANTHMELKGIDNVVLETCVAQLKEKGLIILKAGADRDSLDYHDYLVSADRDIYNDWYDSTIKNSVSLLGKLISIVK